MTKSKLCPRCGGLMQRLYMKKNKQLKGFGWLCWNCSTTEKTYTVLDENYHSYISRRAESMFWVPRLKGYRKVLKRTVYFRSKNSWKAGGWLLLPYGDVVLDQELSESGGKGVRRVATGAITKYAAVSAFSFRCECGRTYTFDVLREEMHVHAPGGKPKAKVAARPYSLCVECPRCGADNEYVVEGRVRRLVEIACKKCKLRGVLDINTRRVHWESWSNRDALKASSARHIA